MHRQSRNASNPRESSGRQRRNRQTKQNTKQHQSQPATQRQMRTAWAKPETWCEVIDEVWLKRFSRKKRIITRPFRSLLFLGENCLTKQNMI